MKIGLAQLNPLVGDLAGNAAKVLAAWRAAAAAGADAVLAPELALTGYPPRDLLFQSRFVPTQLEELDRLEAIVQAEGGPALVVGFVEPRARLAPGQFFHNSAAVLQKGHARQIVRKSQLPTYDVFDEARYFEPAESVAPVEIAGRRVGVTICEDIWTDAWLPRHLYLADPVERLINEGATLILNLSASPYDVGKPARRRRMVAGLAARHGVPFAYCNTVGANDELVFDGHSFCVDAHGRVSARLAAMDEEVRVVDLAAPGTDELSAERPDGEERDLHRALVLGVRDYLRKCGFKTAVLGLSGGIDSALVAALAADALGAENVLGVLMPGPYSSEGSVLDARALAERLGIRHTTIPITEAWKTVRAGLAQEFAGRPEDVTEENMQARLRGITLMSLSNKFGHLLLTTGNKSELAVGYCTLYGDMCGGLAVISDVSKTWVYRLSRWINADRGQEVIPRATIEKPPSAELRPNQTDQDSLPPYDVLDAILDFYVEDNLGSAEIIARGFDEPTVRRVLRLVDLAEYKRRQAAPGLKVTSRAFGMGRRRPIAQGYRA